RACRSGAAAARANKDAHRRQQRHHGPHSTHASGPVVRRQRSRAYGSRTIPPGGGPPPGFSRSELGCSFEQCSLRHRESVQPSVERFISRAECRLKRTPILLVAPTVDGQKSIAAIPVAIQLGTEEPGGSAEQLSPSTLRSVGNTK